MTDQLTGHLTAAPLVPIKVHKKRRVRVLRPSQIIKKQRQAIDIGGDIGASIGLVEPGTKIFITGPSYSGKSSFIIRLCGLFSKHMKVDYNNHEEKGGDASTVKKKMGEGGIDESFDGRIRFYKAPIVSDEEETFSEIIAKKKSAGFVVLDSVQHANLNKLQYIAFTNRFCNPKKGKIVVFICHWVKNDYMKHIKHDCDVKIEVIGFVANVESRLPGANNKPILIYEEGAKKHWKKNLRNVLSGDYWPGRKK